MDNLYTYSIIERLNSFHVYIIIEGDTIKVLYAYNSSLFRTIKDILFLKGIKLIKHHETSIPIEVFNLIKPYLNIDSDKVMLYVD